MGDAPWGVSEPVSQRCSHCGGAVPSDEWHPVATVRDGDGDIEIHDFCGEDCRAAWERERAE